MDGRDPWEHLVPEHLLGQSGLPGMLVYDTQDPEIALTQFEEMARLWTDCAVHSTHGLGHNRLLKDNAVIAAIADFMKF